MPEHVALEGHPHCGTPLSCMARKFTLGCWPRLFGELFVN